MTQALATFTPFVSYLWGINGSEKRKIMKKSLNSGKQIYTIHDKSRCWRWSHLLQIQFSSGQNGDNKCIHICRALTIIYIYTSSSAPKKSENPLAESFFLSEMQLTHYFFLSNIFATVSIQLIAGSVCERLAEEILALSCVLPSAQKLTKKILREKQSLVQIKRLHANVVRWVGFYRSILSPEEPLKKVALWKKTWIYEKYCQHQKIVGFCTKYFAVGTARLHVRRSVP